MVQLNFDAATATEALAAEPVTTIFAQHEGGEVADWNDPKVHRDGDHVAVYPGQGSHASYYGQSVWFGKSSQSGFGCDNTSVGRGMTAQATSPAVVMLTDQPWLSYTGHWGQQAPSFNNGPTGPNTKTQWETPIEWARDEGRPDGRRAARGARCVGQGLLQPHHRRARWPTSRCWAPPSSSASPACSCSRWWSGSSWGRGGARSTRPRCGSPAGWARSSSPQRESCAGIRASSCRWSVPSW